MPYPIAHPAAVIALHPLLGAHGVASALVIGSIVPDLWPLIPGLERPQSHSLGAILWFCLPLGVVLYLAYHLIIKRPLFDLLPDWAAARLGGLMEPGRSLPRQGWAAISLSLALGALTHVAWDALTHADGAVVEAFPIFKTMLLDGGRYRLALYQVLQHGSTLLGALFVLWWCWRWMQRAPRRQVARTGRVTPRQRAWLLIALPGAAIGGALLSFLERAEPITSIEVLRMLVRAAATGGVAAFVLALLAYGIVWSLHRAGTKA